MSILYNLAFIIFSMFYLPRFLLKIRHEPDRKRLLRERLGIFPPAWKEKFQGRTTLWLHAVSVGEVMAVKKFLEKLCEALPEAHVHLTTVTPTGQEVARKLEGEKISVSYFPFDLTWAVRNFFKTIRPSIVLLTETEIWPNLLLEAHRLKVPAGIINARLSRKSCRRYRRILILFRSLFQKLDFVLAQTESDGRRFAELGVPPARISVLGNVKFDNAPDFSENCGASAVSSLKEEWGFQPQDQVWAAGSTHRGEEEKLLPAFQRLRKRFDSLKMVLAPRHIERCRELKRKIEKMGLKTGMASSLSCHSERGKRHFDERSEEKSRDFSAFSLEMTSLSPQDDRSFDILIVDKIGILKHLYAFADVVFIGGSLVPHGGQNPIEAAGFRKALLHGPCVFHFEKVYQALGEEGGALEVRDGEQLVFALDRLLENENERRRLGENAFAAIQKLKGASGRHVQWICDFLATPAQERIVSNVEFDEKLFPAPGGGT